MLGGLNLNASEYKNGDNQPSLEALTVFRHVLRVCRGIRICFRNHDRRLDSSVRSYGGSRDSKEVWSPSQAWGRVVRRSFGHLMAR